MQLLSHCGDGGRTDLRRGMMNESFPRDRCAALARLAAFAPRMGHHYAAGRNTDPGPG
jgi:hypothetical protein